MNREQLIHDLSTALIERDHYRKTQEEMRIKADEAQSRAYELELMLFEPACLPPAPPISIIGLVMDAFDKPRRVRDVVRQVGLTRQQVQTALTRLIRQGKLVQKSRGVYGKKEGK